MKLGVLPHRSSSKCRLGGAGGPGPPLLVLNLGSFEPGIAAIAGDRVRLALGAAGRRVKLLREGDTATVQMGPFESQDAALGASQKMDLAMNLNTGVLPIPEAGF